jgi:hypothetical protein
VAASGCAKERAAIGYVLTRAGLAYDLITQCIPYIALVALLFFLSHTYRRPLWGLFSLHKRPTVRNKQTDLSTRERPCYSPCTKFLTQEPCVRGFMRTVRRVAKGAMSLTFRHTIGQTAGTRHTNRRPLSCGDNEYALISKSAWRQSGAWRSRNVPRLNLYRGASERTRFSRYLNCWT